jgi:Sec-independent protein translocase protein TatA
VVLIVFGVRIAAAILTIFSLVVVLLIVLLVLPAIKIIAKNAVTAGIAICTMRSAMTGLCAMLGALSLKGRQKHDARRDTGAR